MLASKAGMVAAPGCRVLLVGLGCKEWRSGILQGDL